MSPEGLARTSKSIILNVSIAAQGFRSNQNLSKPEGNELREIL